MIKSDQYGHMDFLWDRNGNMQGIVSEAGFTAYHLYDEDNNMVAAINNKSAAYYGYNASQQRMFKLTGMNMFEGYDAGEICASAYFDDFR